MRMLRGLLGALLWIVASLVGLVAVVLCVTVILLPVGIPLLMFARRMFGRSVALMLPRGMSHPVDEGRKKSKKSAGKASKQMSKKAGSLSKKAGKMSKKADKLSKKARPG